MAKIPGSKYPAGAIQDYYAALARAIDEWFAQLKAELMSIHQLVIHDASLGEIIAAQQRNNAATKSTTDLLHNTIAQSEMQRQINATRQANEALRRRLAGEQVSKKMDSARAKWLEANEKLKAATAQASKTVSRTSQNLIDRQIQIAMQNRRLNVAFNRPAFGDLQGAVDKFTKANAALIKDIGEKAARDVEYLVQDAVSRGASQSEITDILQRHLGITKTRAQLIAEHQCTSLQAELDSIHAKAAGSTTFYWLHTRSPAPRRDHLENVGKVFSWDDRPLPGMLPHCKCGTQAIFNTTE